MKDVRLGVIGASDIAKRRFLPALSQARGIKLYGIASRDIDKAKALCDIFSGIPFGDYGDIIKSDDVDALYICLPPALHYYWAVKAIEANKHVLLEKPATDKYENTLELLSKAAEKEVVVYENYTHLCHGQLTEFKRLITNGTIGSVNAYFLRFGFPHRAKDDFRYDKNLGGGALLDCGGYCISLALELLGANCRIVGGKLLTDDELDVDMSGFVILSNGESVANLSFGMNNEYVCEAEAWGSTGRLIAPRIFTAPPDFNPVFTVITNGEAKQYNVDRDNQFLNSIDRFCKLISNKEDRPRESESIRVRSWVIEEIKRPG